MKHAWLLFAFLVLAFCQHDSVDAADRDKPNVLFLICDDLNCDIGCYGHPLVKTPCIDALASRGVRFPNAHCQFALCGPSRASFMAGWYPDQTCIWDNVIHLRERSPHAVTIPQHFQQFGYFATRVGKIYHYQVPLHVGTGGHDDPFSWNKTINPRGSDMDDMEAGKIFTLAKGRYGGTMSWLAAQGSDEEQTDGVAATEVIRMLENHKPGDKPFFLAVGLYRPHTPYVAPKKWFDMYPIDQIKVPTVPENYLETLPKPAQRSLLRKKEQINLDPELAKQAIQAYYASISFADAQVGRILAALDQSGLGDNTIVLFTSDHGYHMGEHGYYQKTTLFENATRVPLVIAGPGVSKGQVAETFAEMTDLYPTLVELAGLDPQKSNSGKSLVPALKLPASQIRDSALSQYRNGYSLRVKDFRFTMWGEDGAEGFELYDHRSDAAEMVNVAGQEDYAQVQEELMARLKERVAQANLSPQGFERVERKIQRQIRKRKKKR